MDRRRTVAEKVIGAMFSCKYCGKWVGLFRTAHISCADERQREIDAESKLTAERERQKAEAATSAMAVIQRAAASDALVVEVLQELGAIDRGAPGSVLLAFNQWLSKITDTESNPEPPTSRDEQMASALIAKFQINTGRLSNYGWGRFVRLCAWRDILDGQLPSRVTIAGDLPFLLESGERVAWVFNSADYLEDKVVRTPARTYAGVSVRIAPGLYGHTGQRLPSQTASGFVEIDKGILALSDRAILFQGSHKAVRFKYKDAVAIKRFDFGFSVCKGSQTARNLGFEVEDILPAFPYLMVKGLAELWLKNNA